jgi:hypothetical protein
MPSKDPALDAVVAWLAEEKRINAAAKTIRQAINFVLDGQNTGRFKIAELDKLEKTFVGTKVEHYFLNNLGLPKASLGEMDTIIAGQKADVKFTLGNTWTIPPETIGNLAILLSVNDNKSVFSMGVIRIADDDLTSIAGKGNRDKKRGLKARARDKKAVWLARNKLFPEEYVNFLLHLLDDDRIAILSAGRAQARINELFRRVIDRRIHKTVLETISRQQEARARARDAEKTLNCEGVFIFSYKENAKLCKMGFAPLPKDYWISKKLAPPDSQ